MTVYLVPWDRKRNLLEEANRLYDEAGTFDGVEKGDLVAVKLHVGELETRIMCSRFLSMTLFAGLRRQAANQSLQTPTRSITRIEATPTTTWLTR